MFIQQGSDAGTIERWSSNGSGDLISSKFHGGGHVHDAAVTAVTCTSSGTIVSGGRDGAINLWNVTGDTRLRTIPFAHVGSVHDLAASADGTMLASCGEDGYVRVWRMGHATTARTAVSAPSRHPIAERRGEDIRVGAGRAFCVAWCESVAALAIGFESGDVAFLDADRNVDSGGNAYVRVGSCTRTATRCVVWRFTTGRSRWPAAGTTVSQRCTLGNFQ